MFDENGVAHQTTPGIGSCYPSQKTGQDTDATVIPVSRVYQHQQSSALGFRDI